MEYNNEAKLKEQNSSRLTNSKKRLAVTKGKGGGEGTEGYCDWYTQCRGGHREDSVAQRRHVLTLWHLTTLMDSDFSGVREGLDNMGECSNHNVFHMKPS